jgi:predicted nucleic acid-binding protein
MAQGLILVADSSVWISFYRKPDSIAKLQLAEALRLHTILLPDVVLVEVLRGIESEKEAGAIAREFESFQIIEAVGKLNALKAAKNYRYLRSKGKTIRGTVDLLIATWCIENDVPLLHADRDFSGFEEHLGLKRWFYLE